MRRRNWVAIVVGVALAVRPVAGAADEDRVPALPPYPLGPVVVLADGGIVAGRLETITPDGVTVESSLLGRLDLPRAAVAGYRASMALGPVPPRRPDSEAGEAAVVRLVNGDTVIPQHLTIEAGDATIRMKSPVPQDVTIPLESVRAIDFAESPREVTLPRRWVALADGSRFVETSVPKVCDPADVVATLVDGTTIRLLQILDPLEVAQAAEGSPAWRLARGSTLSGHWPSARGTTAFTALGMQAPSRVRYRLPAPARRFESLVAIDDSAREGGSVIARVRAIDAAGTGRELYASPILWGGDEPHPISIDLGGAVELELILDPADGSALLDRTIWLDPRVVSDPDGGA